MCLMAPGQVIAIDGPMVMVAVSGRRRAASILAEPGVRVGDWVVVAGDIVLRRIDPATASAMTDAVELASAPDPRPSPAGRPTEPRGAPGD